MQKKVKFMAQYIVFANKINKYIWYFLLTAYHISC